MTRLPASMKDISCRNTEA